MTQRQKIQLSIVIFLLLCVGVFVGQYVYNQHQREKGSPEGVTVQNFLNSDEAGADEDEGEETLDADDPLNVPDTEAEAKKSSAYVVDQETCDNECTRYQNDPEALAYCQAVCGFAPNEGGQREAPENCDDRTDTAKDICWRDKAVAEKNPRYCENIIDQSLRKSCHNRLAEEYFDQ